MGIPTHCHEVARRPLLRTLLQEFEQVSSIIIVSHKMSAVDD
jgi:hypothetical protein